MALKFAKDHLRVAEILERKGWTLIDLAERITRTDADGNVRTVTTATLSSRLNGNPSLSNLYEIAEALGVKITELFPDDEQYLPVDGQAQPQQGFFKLETICPSCGQRITASISAE